MTDEVVDAICDPLHVNVATFADLLSGLPEHAGDVGDGLRVLDATLLGTSLGVAVGGHELLSETGIEVMDRPTATAAGGRCRRW
ncbi:hypothetical protein [Streptomyces sp. BV129]|uniref:hypothetical protein n=1 Tax=Streptomyces sp. BV129 TaxID=2849671 RepID=UPI001C2EFB68|nr:hypothetical protein [Streptomyces sp. BV129]MBV1949415.1 hypothetical protein [Streptomyces sp. BV129]